MIFVIIIIIIQLVQILIYTLDLHTQNLKKFPKILPPPYLNSPPLNFDFIDRDFTMAMRNSECGSSIILLSFFLIVLFSVQIEAKNQKEALDALYKAKFFKNSKAARGFSSQLLVNSESATTTTTNNQNAENVEIYDQTGMKKQDKIVRLPGQPPNVRLSQYGGYVTVNKSAGRAFYYYFVEAPHNKKSLPLLLWLNGGAYVCLNSSSMIVQFS